MAAFAVVLMIALPAITHSEMGEIARAHGPQDRVQRHRTSRTISFFTTSSTFILFGHAFGTAGY